MIKLAIMQPYFLPYIGTFQLIDKVDTYVFLDDVSYIKGGFINRNTFYYNGLIKYITLPLKNISTNKKILEHEPVETFKKILEKIDKIYKSSLYYDELNLILNDLYKINQKNIAKINGEAIKVICDNFGLKCKFLYSSEINNDKSLKREHRLYDLCHKLKATNYINTSGGKLLYNKSDFKKKNIKLSFFKADLQGQLRISLLNLIALKGLKYVKQNIAKGFII